MKCSACGKDNDVKANFCSNCGNALIHNEHGKKGPKVGNVLPLDEIISKIVALGIPGLILFFVMSSTGFVGAAALTAALAAIGPGGMVAGIVTLGLIGVVSGGIAKYGSDALAKGIIKGLLDKGESKESIINNLNKYPLSKGLKRMIIEYVRNYRTIENKE